MMKIATDWSYAYDRGNTDYTFLTGNTDGIPCTSYSIQD